MPISEDRFRKWDELDEQGQRKEVWADQAKVFEEWLDQNPERAEELVSFYAKPGLPPNESNLPESYHWSGLYWLAANVAFRRFGFGDQIRQEVGHAVFDRLYGLFQGRDTRPFSMLPENRRDELNAAFGQAMGEAHSKLARIGAEEIQCFERWLAHSARLILRGKRAVDPETKKRQRREQRNPAAQKERLSEVEGTEADEGSTGSTSAGAVPQLERPANRPIMMAPPRPRTTKSLPRSWAPLADDHADDDPFSTVNFKEFVRRISDQQKAILGPLLINPYLSNGELAKHFNLTPQRIGQIRKEIEKLWESL